MSRPALLHNSGAPSRTIIQHKTAAPMGRTLLFRLPPEIPNTGPGGLLAQLTGRSWATGDATADAEL